jgi:hypothetical protein
MNGEWIRVGNGRWETIGPRHYPNIFPGRLRKTASVCVPVTHLRFEPRSNANSCRRLVTYPVGSVIDPKTGRPMPANHFLSFTRQQNSVGTHPVTVCTRICVTSRINHQFYIQTSKIGVGLKFRVFLSFEKVTALLRHERR